MKRIAALLIALITVLPIIPAGVPAEEAAVSHKVHGVDTSRGADQIIVYTVSGERTGTNQWGYEARVGKDGVIISAGGNDSVVPDGGFVISGHGDGASWVRENCTVGRHARFYDRVLVVAVGDGEISPFYESDFPINGVNKPRAYDNIIVYYGKKTTGTNQWGFEACVDATGRVISLGGNDNAVPEGGFVISGHGAGADFVRETITVGMYASFDESKLTVTLKYGGDSLAYELTDMASRALEIARNAKENYLVTPRDAISAAEKLVADTADLVARYRKGALSANGLYDAGEELTERYERVVADSSESFPMEYRAVWLRPKETTQAAVAATVEKLHALGVNAIYIETQYDCCAIFPTPAGCLMEQNPLFKGFDVLQAYIEECHSRGMELHCWMPVFYVGGAASANASRAVFTKRPDFCVKNNLGTYYDEDGGAFMMLDPSNPEATAFLLDLYKYVLTHYDIDCFQLDYIRYLGRSSVDWGFFSNAAEDFRKKYGFAPTLDVSAPWWSGWCEIRAGYVTDFVRSMRRLVDSVSPGTLLSADVFYSLESAATSICQDYPKWVDEGLLDILHPMTYGAQTPYASMPAILQKCAGKCVIAPGIGAYLADVGETVIREQIEYMRGDGMYGSAVFESTGFLSKAGAVSISHGVFGSAAYSPLLEPEKAVSSVVEFVKAKARLLHDGGCYTDEGYASIVSAADEFLKTAVNSPEAAAKSLVEALISVGSKRTQRMFSRTVGKLAQFAFLLEKGKGYVPSADDVYVYAREKTSFEEFASAFGRSVSVRRDDGAKYVFTGETVIFTVGEEEFKLTVIVKGDLNRDGSVSAVDYAMAKRAVIGTYTLDPAQDAAARVSGKAKLSAADYAMIKRHVLGTYDIFKA